MSFDPFLLDAERRLLLRGPEQQPVHLSPKAYELLCVLVETRPRAIAKSELHERLWPSTFVSEATLATTALHGLARNVTDLNVLRLMLGLGEGGSFPAAAKAVSERFSAKERSFAVGLYNTGSGLGAMIAPPLIAVVVLSMGWRGAFFAAGVQDSSGRLPGPLLLTHVRLCRPSRGRAG